MKVLADHSNSWANMRNQIKHTTPPLIPYLGTEPSPPNDQVPQPNLTSHPKSTLPNPANPIPTQPNPTQPKPILQSDRT